MTHPCAGHPCDGCDLCRAGVCCMTVSADQRGPLEAHVREQDSRLRTAIRLEAGAVSSLGELVRFDVAAHRVARQLGAGALPSSPLALPPAAAEIPSTNSRKEALHVVIPRSIP